MPRITLLLIVIAVTMCAERRHALERPGLHHATIEGRVVDQRGVPIAGTLVQLAQSSVRSLPMSEAVAGSDGSFRFVDVSAQTGVELRLFPPSGWSGGTVSVPSASGRMVLLGDLRLEQALTIYLLIEETGKETAQGARPEVSAAFDAGPVRRRVASRQAQGMLVLDGVPKVKGRLEVTRRQGREWEMYRSDLDLSTEGGDFISVQLQRDSMAKTEYGRLEGRMTVTRVSGPPQPLSAAIFSEGRLLWPDGSPAAGVIVSRHDPSSGESGSFGRTAEDGRFRLRADSPCARPGVRHLHNIYPWPTPDSTTACAPAEATISAATRLSLQTTGMPSVLTAAASWWSEDRGWQPIRSLEGWTVYANYPAQVTVKMEAPGYVPVVRPISYVRVDERKGENYPDRVTQIFPFDGQSTRTVEVSGDGRPLSSATVDIESIQELNRNRRLPLGTYRTDARGRLTLLGEANALIEAFVYAEGFEPQRVIWRDGRPVSLDLRRKSAVLVVAGLRRGETVRSAPAEVVAVDNEVSSDGGDEIRLPMAPGDHEVTILDDRGRVKLTQRVKLSAGESVTLHPDRDDRPRVRVLFNGQT